MKEIIKEIIRDQKRLSSNEFIPRDIASSFISCPEITIISGVRRCGKSTLMHQFRNILPEKDYYFNFDDERLINFNVLDFQKLYEVFIELYGVQKTFYFDEIQNIKGWERFVRRIYDAGNKVFVTGSNASMLSRELGTHLTGRYVTFVLFPFSFREYLLFNKINITSDSIYSTPEKSIIIKYFRSYLKDGGFPQYCISLDGNVLHAIYESLVYRDILARNNISNVTELLQLLYNLATNATNPTTYNALAQLVNISHSDTIKQYIKAVEDTYLLTQIYKFDYSLKKQYASAKKCYFIDNAILHRIGFKATDNFGQLLENLVFIELQRRRHKIYFAQNGYECDFLIAENLHVTQAIQVCYDLSNEKTNKREINSLLKAMEIYNLQEGFILTMDTQDELEINDKKISTIPVWKWMLM